MYATYVWVLWRPERGVESSGIGVIGIWEPSSVGARNQTQTLSPNEPPLQLLAVFFKTTSAKQNTELR